MKKFSFRLEPVLKTRETKEEQAIIAYSLAQKEYRSQQEKLEVLRDRLRETSDYKSDGTSAHDFLARTLYINYLNISIKKQEDVVETALKELERKREALVKARKDKLIMQKLKEKLYEDYLSDLNRWEAAVNDDQCMAQAYRKK
ncbi:MAG: flagellar export protein FliJ [Bacillota bacterium]